MTDLYSNPVIHRGIVVVAASAGGVRAVSTLIGGLPEGFEAPVVIVQHRPSDKPSLLAEVLSKSTELPVEDAGPGNTIDRGRIYIARPDLHLTVTVSGHFAYVDGRRVSHVLSSADPLFLSAANVYRHQAIGVVLSGTGRDGTEGAKAIKAGGGTVIAQDEWTSQHFEMPGSAIESGAADYVLPIEAIAPALVRLVHRD